MGVIHFPPSQPDHEPYSLKGRGNDITIVSVCWSVCVRSSKTVQDLESYVDTRWSGLTIDQSSSNMVWIWIL